MSWTDTEKLLLWLQCRREDLSKAGVELAHGDRRLWGARDTGSV